MTTRKQELEKRPTAVPVEAERTRPRRVLVPAADIYERDDSLVVVADMPGVDEKSIDIRVERNILTIEGRVEPPALDGFELVYSELDTGDYHRAFTLSDEVDVNKIEASVRHGVLRIVLPKAEQARPRKITVKSG